MHDNEQLIESLREVLERRPEIQKAYLFGSRARGHAGAHSVVQLRKIDAAHAARIARGSFGR